MSNKVMLFLYRHINFEIIFSGENILKVKPSKRIVLNIFMLLIPIGFVIYFFVSENGFIDLLSNMETFNWWWIVSGVFCQFANIFIDAYVLFKITHNDERNFTLKKSMKTTAVGQFFSVITPGAIGGQPMQLYSMKKQNIDTGIATSSLMQKFLIYQTTITIYSFVAWICNLNIFQGHLGGTMLGLALFGFISHAVVILFVFMFSFNRKLTSSIINKCFKMLSKLKIIKNASEKTEKLEYQLMKFHESNVKLYRNKKTLISICTLTVLQLTLIFSIPYTVYRSFNFVEANFFDMLTGQAFVTMVSSFMPLPGGSGAAEGSFYVFFDTFFKENTIKSAILVWRIITYFMNIIVFAPFARVGSIAETMEKLKKQKN